MLWHGGSMACFSMLALGHLLSYSIFFYQMQQAKKAAISPPWRAVQVSGELYG